MKLCRPTYQSIHAGYQPHADDHDMLEESRILRIFAACPGEEQRISRSTKNSREHWQVIMERLRYDFLASCFRGHISSTMADL